MAKLEPNFDVKPVDVFRASKFLKDKVLHTPLEYSKSLSKESGADVFLKLENYQICRSFKLRGALNIMYHLPFELKRDGVITCSSGNHGQGVAIAANLLKVKSIIVVPKDCPEVKKEAIKEFGGEYVELIEHGIGYDQAKQKADEIAEEKDLPFIPAGEHSLIMAGAGTVGLEIIEDLPDVDVVLVPAGSGGLMTGIATILKAINPEVKVYGIQTDASPVWYEAFKNDKVVPVDYKPTIAEGLFGEIYEQMYPVAKERIDGIILVTEDETKEAVKYAFSKLHLMVEGSGAVGIAALLFNKLEDVFGKKVAVVISGGNIDASLICEILSS